MLTTEVNEKKIKGIKDHIEALEVAYSNVIAILKRELESEFEEQEESSEEEEPAPVQKKRKVSETQIKTYVTGLGEAADVADALLEKIQTKYSQLEKLENPKDESGGTQLSDRLK